MINPNYVDGLELKIKELIAERDAALAQNAELAAQVETFKSLFTGVKGVCSDNDFSEPFYKIPAIDADLALQKSPSQCLRQIQADAILSAIKFFKGSRDIDVEALESYANRVKDGEL